MRLYNRLYAGVLGIHERIYKASDGRIGQRLFGRPTLLLRTVGRRTGELRTNALVYARDRDRWLIVPSNGGARRAPGWFHNLAAQPRVEIQIGRERRAATAVIVGRDDPQFERLWESVNAVNRGLYDTYQARCPREIPVVALRPA